MKLVNFTLLSTPWYIDQMKRRTYNSMPVPSVLTHEDYREGTNDQVYLMSPDQWKDLFSSLAERGIPESSLSEFKQFQTQDSMTVKDAVNFLKKKSEGKDAILKLLFGESKYERFNFLPVSRFVIPVNKANAVKSGIIKPQDAALAVDQITVDYKRQSMFKNSMLLMDILANFDWKRPINFSSGGVYDPENIFYLGDYLQFDGFSYRLVPIKTPEDDSGDMGRVDADDLYRIVKNFKWGNFKDLNVHFDETCTQNILSLIHI